MHGDAIRAQPQMFLETVDRTLAFPLPDGQKHNFINTNRLPATKPMTAVCGYVNVKEKVREFTTGLALSFINAHLLVSAIAQAKTQRMYFESFFNCQLAAF